MASDITANIRAKVARQAQYRCEYCGIHEDDAGFPHQVDHIVSRKHGGLSELDNLAYACVLCNRYKGSDVASVLQPGESESGMELGQAVRLFHPRRDRWNDHFRFTLHVVEALSASGRATVRLLRLNAPERVAERRLIYQ